MRLRSHNSTTCRTNSQPKDLPAAGSQITQTLASISAAGLVIASAGFGAVYAVGVGAQHGPLLASLTVSDGRRAGIGQAPGRIVSVRRISSAGRWLAAWR